MPRAMLSFAAALLSASMVLGAQKAAKAPKEPALKWLVRMKDPKMSLKDLKKFGSQVAHCKGKHDTWGAEPDIGAFACFIRDGGKQSAQDEIIAALRKDPKVLSIEKARPKYIVMAKADLDKSAKWKAVKSMHGTACAAGDLQSAAVQETTDKKTGKKKIVPLKKGVPAGFTCEMSDAAVAELREKFGAQIQTLEKDALSQALML